MIKLHPAAALLTLALLLPPAVLAEDATTTILKKSVKTPKGDPFVLAKAPALPDLAEAGMAPEPSFVDTFDPGWTPKEKGWRVATWTQNKTAMSPERCAVNADGLLEQTLLAGDPARGGSIQSTREFGWGRWVARVKAASVPGVLNSIFTKDWDDLTTSDSEHDGKKGEVDIELLSHTYGPNKGEAHLAIHLLNHPSHWQLDVPIDFNPSDDFHEWGFDILPDRVVWHVDGKVLHTWMYTDEFRIDPDYEFFFNSWTQKKWILGPPEKDAVYQIDWVKFYPLQSK